VTGAEVVVIVGAVVVTAWWVDVKRHPIRRCPSCNGSKRNSGSSGQRWGTCRRCGGEGEVRRFFSGKNPEKKE
jgi:DnaJ-class molecular chaperone